MSKQIETVSGFTSAFTPGPWTVTDPWLDDCKFYEINNPGGGVLVATVAQEANANLIAAAPALFEALQDLIQAHETDMGPSAIQLRIDLARAALAQAQGKP